MRKHPAPVIGSPGFGLRCVLHIFSRNRRTLVSLADGCGQRRDHLRTSPAMEWEFFRNGSRFHDHVRLSKPRESCRRSASPLPSINLVPVHHFPLRLRHRLVIETRHLHLSRRGFVTICEKKISQQTKNCFFFQFKLWRVSTANLTVPLPHVGNFGLHGVPVKGDAQQQLSLGRPSSYCVLKTRGTWHSVPGARDIQTRPASQQTEYPGLLHGISRSCCCWFPCNAAVLLDTHTS